MSEPKWTPGPWAVEFNDTFSYLRGLEDGTFEIANNDASENWIAQAQTRENAALIATAPDLYAALEAIVDFWNSRTGSPDKTICMLHDSGFIEDARAALRKARGEA